jgi:hypothetical protein
MLWGPTAFEVPHRPSRTGQSGWNESLPAGNMQVKSSARIFPRAHLNVTDLQSVCHWLVTLGIIRAVQKLFRGVAVPNHSVGHADKMAERTSNASRIISSVDLKIDGHLNPTLKPAAYHDGLETTLTAHAIFHAILKPH